MRHRFLSSRYRNSGSAEADLTPMLDIVFILLIFFIVTATFLKEQAMLLTPPPQGSSSKTMPTILVSLSEEGLVRVNGELSDVGMIRARIERALAENPDQAVIVQAHSNTRTRLILLAVDQARSAGVQNVGLSVDKA